MNAIIQGSLGAIARQENQSIAETFLSANCIVIVDVSGSMGTGDARGGQSRYDVACQELEHLQNSLPGKIAVLAFSRDTIFCPSGKPTFMGSCTNLAGALKFARVADVPGMRFIVISDGDPDNREQALDEARKYQNHIDVIYVGYEGGSGQKFLSELAHTSGGKHTTVATETMHLEAGIKHLLQEG